MNEILSCSFLDRRTHQRNCIALVAPIDVKILSVHRDNGVPGIDLAHANQAQVCQVRRPITIATRQGFQVIKVVAAIEGQPDQTLADHG